MALKGSVDHVTIQTNATANQELFTSIFRFMNGQLRSSSYVEPVALSYGTGTGSNYPEETNAFGENAFSFLGL